MSSAESKYCIHPNLIIYVHEVFEESHDSDDQNRLYMIPQDKLNATFYKVLQKMSSDRTRVHDLLFEEESVEHDVYILLGMMLTESEIQEYLSAPLSFGITHVVDELDYWENVENVQEHKMKCGKWLNFLTSFNTKKHNNKDNPIHLSFPIGANCVFIHLNFYH
jgi:hypothetical protein